MILLVHRFQNAFARHLFAQGSDVQFMSQDADVAFSGILIVDCYIILPLAQ